MIPAAGVAGRCSPRYRSVDVRCAVWTGGPMSTRGWLHSVNYEWDSASTADAWKRAHNHVHHTTSVRPVVFVSARRGARLDAVVSELLAARVTADHPRPSASEHVDHLKDLEDDSMSQSNVWAAIRQ